MAVTQYIGSRYVPLFADPIEWSASNTYEPLTIVIHEGNSYTSKQAVPKGIDIANESFWALTGNYNAQVELYRRETAIAKAAADDAQADAAAAQTDIDTLLPKADFSAENTVKDYIDALAFPTNNPIHYGADPSGIADSSAAIRACIAANKGGEVVFTSGTYGITEPIETSHLASERVSIDFGGSTLKPLAQMNSMLVVGGIDDVTSQEAGLIRTFYKNGTFANDNGLCACGIKVANFYKDASILDMNIIGFVKGIIIHDNTGSPSDTQITNCLIRYTDTTQNDGVGITYNGSDNKISNSRIYGYHTCILVYGSMLYANTLHNLPKGLTDANYLVELAGSCFFDLHASAVLSDCYCDTYETFVRLNDSAVNLEMTNCHMYSYESPMNMTFIEYGYSGNFNGTVNLMGCTFNNKPAPEGTRNRTIKFNANDNNNATLKRLTVTNCTALGSVAQLDSCDLFGPSGMSINGYWANNRTSQSWTPLCGIIAPNTAQFQINLDISMLYYVTRFAKLCGMVERGSNNTLNFEHVLQFNDVSFTHHFGYTYDYIQEQNIYIIIIWMDITDTDYTLINNTPMHVVFPYNGNGYASIDTMMSQLSHGSIDNVMQFPINE